MSETPPRTVRDGGPGTRRDGVAGTVRDGVAGTVRDGVAGTVRDGVGRSATYTRVNLLPSLQVDYEAVEDLSGVGGEADLLLCRSRADGERVVVKLYRQRGVKVDDATMTLLQRDDGRHLTRPLHWGQDDGFTWEVQEYLPEGSLQQLADRDGPALPFRKLHAVLVELAAALEHLHTLHLVHRDVKPSNVLVRHTEPLELVLADFGLAVTLGASREMRSGSRTSAYAAPEAAWGDTSAGRDWWSLGITLLELGTGTNPFRRADGSWLEDAQIGRELATVPIDVSAMPSQRWQHLLRGLLVRDPTHRWRAAEVRQWLDGENPAVYQEDTALPGVTPPRERRRPFAFQGRSHRDPVSLARHMSEQWDAAAAVVGTDLDELAGWLEASHAGPDTVRVLRELRKHTWRPDRALAELLVALDPDGTPTFRGWDIHPAALSTLAESALGEARAQAPGPAFDTVGRLQNSRALLAYSVLDGCEDLVTVDDRWKQGKVVLDAIAVEKARPVPAELHTIIAASGTAAVLLAVTDDDTALLQHDRATVLATASAARQPWFARLLEHPDGPARDWVVALAAGVAEQATRSDDLARAAAAEREAEAERQRVRQERAAAAALRRTARRTTRRYRTVGFLQLLLLLHVAYFTASTIYLLTEYQQYEQASFVGSLAGSACAASLPSFVIMAAAVAQLRGRRRGVVSLLALAAVAGTVFWPPAIEAIEYLGRWVPHAVFAAYSNVGGFWHGAIALAIPAGIAIAIVMLVRLFRRAPR